MKESKSLSFIVRNQHTYPKGQDQETAVLLFLLLIPVATIILMEKKNTLPAARTAEDCL
jgi:hypothetical protein